MECAATVPLHSAGGGGGHAVFVYGSLLENEIVRSLIGRVPPSFPALLRGYKRFSIKERVYPAIIPVEGKSVHGKVLSEITDSELDVLDAFESFLYERTAVEISPAEKSEKSLAYTYVWAQKDDPRLQGDWDFREWREKHLEEFLTIAARFAEGYLQSPKFRMGWVP